jgi:hypothetical protein
MNRLTEQQKFFLRAQWQSKAVEDQKHRSDISINGRGMLCINDKGVMYEITGVNNTGQWTVKRVF